MFNSGVVGRDIERSNLVTILIFIVIGVASVIPYWSSVYWDFVWDDHILIRDNPHMESPGIASKLILADYTEYSSRNARSGYWRPLIRLSFLMDYRLLGEKPFGYHLMNLIYFAGLTGLLFLLYRRYLHGVIFPVGAALLFAWHPLRAEAVSWIAGRTELLSALCGIGFLLLLDHLIRGEKLKIPTYIMAIACLILSFLSKESGVVFPLLSLVIFKNHLKQQFMKFLGIGVFLGLYLWVRFDVLGLVGTWSGAHVDLVLLPGLISRTIWHYIFITAYPIGLHSESWIPLPESYLDPGVIAGFLITGILFTIAWKFRKIPGVNLGIAWFFIALLPYLQILPLPTIVADRFTFLAAIGLNLSFGAFLQHIYTRAGKRVLKWTVSIFMCCLCISAAFATYGQTQFWIDDAAREQRTSQCGKSPHALFYRGSALFNGKKYSEALTCFSLAAERESRPSAALYYTMALTEFETGNLDEAEKHLRRVLEISPAHPSARLVLAEYLIRKNKVDEAISLLNSEARRHSNSPVPNMLLAQVYMDYRPDPDNAKTQCRLALSKNPAPAERAILMTFLRRLEQPGKSDRPAIH